MIHRINNNSHIFATETAFGFSTGLVIKFRTPGAVGPRRGSVAGKPVVNP
jgi:hypothetical protein